MIVQVFFLIKEIFEGEIVLDNTDGSMTTAIACINTNRRCICIEKDDVFFEIGRKRVEEHQKQLKIFM